MGNDRNFGFCDHGNIAHAKRFQGQHFNYLQTERVSHGFNGRTQDVITGRGWKAHVMQLLLIFEQMYEYQKKTFPVKLISFCNYRKNLCFYGFYCSGQDCSCTSTRDCDLETLKNA